MLTLGWRDQPRRLSFKKSLAPEPKDRVLTAANRTTAEWDKRTRELKKELIRKQQARDRGEEVSSDDDDDDESDEEEGDTEAAGVNWGDLEDEDSLPTQGPFPFHVGGEASPRGWWSRAYPWI